MANIDLSGLKRFQARLQKLKNLDTIAEKIVQRTAAHGGEILESKYSMINTGNETPTVDVRINRTTAQITASGKDVMFEEFGTGYIGLHSNYRGNLPTSGVPVTTAWEYYYDNPKTKRVVGGRRGWFVPKEVTGQGIDSMGFTEGMPSQHQIFDTARELEVEIPNIARTVLNEELRNV